MRYSFKGQIKAGEPTVDGYVEAASTDDAVNKLTKKGFTTVYGLKPDPMPVDLAEDAPATSANKIDETRPIGGAGGVVGPPTPIPQPEYTKADFGGQFPGVYPKPEDVDKQLADDKKTQELVALNVALRGESEDKLAADLKRNHEKKMAELDATFDARNKKSVDVLKAHFNKDRTDEVDALFRIMQPPKNDVSMLYRDPAHERPAIRTVKLLKPEPPQSESTTQQNRFVRAWKWLAIKTNHQVPGGIIAGVVGSVVGGIILLFITNRWLSNQSPMSPPPPNATPKTIVPPASIATVLPATIPVHTDADDWKAISDNGERALRNYQAQHPATTKP